MKPHQLYEFTQSLWLMYGHKTGSNKNNIHIYSEQHTVHSQTQPVNKYTEKKKGRNNGKVVLTT